MGGMMGGRNPFMGMGGGMGGGMQQGPSRPEVSGHYCCYPYLSVLLCMYAFCVFVCGRSKYFVLHNVAFEICD